jgi:hypothetical protein
MGSITFGPKRPISPFLAHGYSGKIGELYQLRRQIDDALTELEGRSGDFPVIYSTTTGVPAAGGTATIRGAHFLTQNGKTQTFASKTFGTGTAALTITALKPGKDGNDITVVIVQGVGALAVTVSSTAITITLAAAGSTANAVATAINADNAQTRGLVRCASGGAGTVLIASLAHLAGGTGLGFYAAVAGVELLPANTAGTAGAAAITNTSIALTVPDLRAQSYPLYPGYDVDFIVRCGPGSVAQQLTLVSRTPPVIQAVDGTAPAAAGGDFELHGSYLTQGQTFASKVFGIGTAALTITALKPGDPGNDFTVVIVQGAGALAVAMVGTDITITLAAAGSTADAVATAINANAADTDGYVRCASGGGGTVLIADQANLEGGVGAGFTCTVGGVEALPANTPGTAGAAAITDAVATLTGAALAGAGLVATDRATIVIVSDNVTSNAPMDILA